MKESGWKFHQSITRGISFYKCVDFNGSSYVKNTLRSSVILIIKNNDKNCFMWSIFAYLHPCEINSNRVSTFKQ